jgi:hypothetical protein
MTTSTATIADFLLARIGDDEALASAAQYGFGSVDVAATESAFLDGPGDPARVLAECAAKRAIVREHALSDYNGVPSCWLCAPGYSWGKEPDEGPCSTLSALASVYASHADFNPAWT